MSDSKKKETLHDNKEHRCANHKDKEDYENTHKLKFVFYFEPKEVTRSIFSIKLSFLVKLISIIYAYRAMKSLHDEIQMYFFINGNINYLTCIFNTICICTSIMIYLSMQKESSKFMNIGYYVYLFHYLIKLFDVFVHIIQMITHKRKISSICGAVLGLGMSSVVNFISSWIMFSQWVYSYNISHKEKAA